MLRSSICSNFEIKNCSSRFSKEISTEEIANAENLWLRTAQNKLKENKNVRNLQEQLGLFEDRDFVIRCKGRIEKAELNYETRFPAILPGDSTITDLIVRKAHGDVFHHGVKATLKEVRSKYWITKGRQRVKRVLRNCTTCKRYEGKPFKYPPPPQLPEYRVRGNFAFSSIGTDLAGPLFTRFTVKCRDTFKVWIVIFTCTLTRALQLEIMQDMSTEQFLLAFRRFISRRGRPHLVISDNARTFKRADESLKFIFKNKEVQEFLTSKRIKWTNILVKAPWYGGFYERLIKTVRRCLKKSLRNAKVTLYTLLVEIESTINNRPLTYLNSDEFDHALTPAHLIYGRRLDLLPDIDLEIVASESDLTPSLLTKRQRYIANLLKGWWSRWSHEYLVDLRETHKLNTKASGTVEINEGDIVTLAEDNCSRGAWRLGKVEHLIRSKDGEVRGATVKVVTPKGKTTLINRPVSKLYPLEVSDNCSTVNVDTWEMNKTELSQEVPRKPRRAAAIDADVIRKLKENI